MVRRVISAGNEIATRPYEYGGGHGSFQSDGYDCSGSVSYALHGGGLMNSPEDSGELESYGESGPGKHITIYANAEHAYMVIDGRRFDTVALAETGRAGPTRRRTTAAASSAAPPGRRMCSSHQRRPRGGTSSGRLVTMARSLGDPPSEAGPSRDPATRASSVPGAA